MDMLDKDLTKIFTKDIDVPFSFRMSIKKALYENNKKNRRKNIIRLVTAIILACASSIGVTFAGVSMHQYYTKINKQNFDTAPGIYQDRDEEYGINTYYDVNHIERFYYKFITSYEDYQKCKGLWTNLYEMEEKDFDEYNVFVISWLGGTNQPLYLSNVDTDENTIYITFNETEDKENYSTLDSFYSIKTLKKDYRENIKIDVIRITPNVDLQKYTNIKDIVKGKEYPIEQALKEDCFVVEWQDGIYRNISNYKESMDKFIENCEKGIPGFIRTAEYYEGKVFSLCDVEFRDGKYYTQFIGKEIGKDELTLYTRIDTKIKKSHMTSDGIYYMWFVNVWNDMKEGWTISMYDE